MDYDIAIVKLARPATLGKYVLTACLPAANDEPPVGSDCYITGEETTPVLSFLLFVRRQPM